MTKLAKKFFTLRNGFILIFSVACLLALWWTTLDLRVIYHMSQHEQLRQELTRRRPTVSDIQPWMTFDYVNVVFKLPPAYLKQSLNITDPHYPNLQISRYARRNNLDPQQLIGQIQNSILNYQSNK